MLARKFEAIVIATLGTALPCFLSGAIVGMFFRSSFWYWTLGIAVMAFLYACLDRIPLRLFTGAMKRLPLGGLFWYGYASTDKRSAYYCSEDDWRYWFLYNSDHHKR
jgi:hypothetical protein